MFRRLSQDDRLHLAGVSRLKTDVKGESIFAEGDPSEFFSIVVSGRVKIVKMTPAGKDVILEIFRTAILSARSPPMKDGRFPPRHRARRHGVPAHAALGVFRPAGAASVTRARPAPGFDATACRVDEPPDGDDWRTGRSADCAAVSEARRQHGRPAGDGIAIPMALSRQELADLTGTTIETCIRVMSRWGKDEIVRTEKDGFVLLDKDALEELAAT